MAERFVRVIRLGVLACAALFSQLAHSDIWGYIDDKGVAHFAQERLDERYEIFSRTGQNFESQRQVTVPTAPPKLIAFFEVSPRYKQVKHLLREAASEHKIEYELLQALIATESGFDPLAVSPRGAVGLMQIMPDTAQRFGVVADVKTPLAKQLTDPRTNIRAGTRYLRYLLTKYPGQMELTLAAYNAGEGAVQRAGNRIPNFPETQSYVRTVMQMFAVLKPPAVLVEQRKSPARVRVAFSGGAEGRGNMPLFAPFVPPALIYTD
jgi:soluble lytic murein transglycosylase-like protein